MQLAPQQGLLTRKNKGSELTMEEMDKNLIYLTMVSVLNEFPVHIDSLNSIISIAYDGSVAPDFVNVNDIILNNDNSFHVHINGGVNPDVQISSNDSELPPFLILGIEGSTIKKALYNKHFVNNGTNSYTVLSTFGTFDSFILYFPDMNIFTDLRDIGLVSEEA